MNNVNNHSRNTYIQMTEPHTTDESRNDPLIAPTIDQNGDDPWIIRHSETYYYSKVVEDCIVIMRSKNITDIAAGERCTVFSDHRNIEIFWAPEIHHINGAWYIYFAAKDSHSPVDSIHRMYVLSNKASDPFTGTWKLDEVKGMDDKFAIDGTTAEISGTRYFIWSGWEGYENIQQNLYIARMISPVQIANEKILISQPQYSWECRTFPTVNEGPAVIVQNNTVNLTYSASGSWSNYYCIGLLTAPIDTDLTNPSVWEKHTEPMLQTGHGIYGPGHNSFVVSPDSSQTEIVYHIARWNGGGFNRCVKIQPISFNPDGQLTPMTPTKNRELIKQPAGEPNRIRLLSRNCTIQGPLLSMEDDSVSIDGYSIQGGKCSSQTISSSAYIPHNGFWTIIIWCRSTTFTNESCEYLIVSINKEQTITLPVYDAQYYQPVMFRTQLPAGTCNISVSFNAPCNPLSVECVEFMPSSKY